MKIYILYDSAHDLSTAQREKTGKTFHDAPAVLHSPISVPPLSTDDRDVRSEPRCSSVSAPSPPRRSMGVV